MLALSPAAFQPVPTKGADTPVLFVKAEFRGGPNFWGSAHRSLRFLASDTPDRFVSIESYLRRQAERIGLDFADNVVYSPESHKRQGYRTPETKHQLLHFLRGANGDPVVRFTLSLTKLAHGAYCTSLLADKEQDATTLADLIRAIPRRHEVPYDGPDAGADAVIAALRQAANAGPASIFPATIVMRAEPTFAGEPAELQILSISSAELAQASERAYRACLDRGLEFAAVRASCLLSPEMNSSALVIADCQGGISVECPEAGLRTPRLSVEAFLSAYQHNNISVIGAMVHQADVAVVAETQAQAAVAAKFDSTFANGAINNSKSTNHEYTDHPSVL